MVHKPVHLFLSIVTDVLGFFLARPVTVKVLDQSHLAKGRAIPEAILDFRQRHFYGSKIQRKDAVLSLSQRNVGAASKFHRRK
jgi:hypothetical protein